MGKKITIIGGGSTMFTPHLLRLFLQSPLLAGSTITLMDVDAKHLDTMATLARRLVAAEDAHLTIESTTDQRVSLVGADFVIVAISVGGMNAWEADIEIPGRYGVFTEVHDSIGPGGMMRAFRHVPILASITRDLAEVSPDAYVFNYTNPAAANSMAMRTTPSIKSFSLCSCVALPMTPQWLAAWAGVPADALAMPPIVAGLNHCAGIVDLRLKDGTDALALIRERDAAAVARSMQQVVEGTDAAMVKRAHEAYGGDQEALFNRFLRSTGLTESVVPWIMETYGLVPYCWTHWMEFFPELQRLTEPYEGRAQGLHMKHGVTIFDMKEKRARVSKWQDLADRWSSPDHAGEVSLAALPAGEEDQGIEVVDVIEAILENRNTVRIVNTTNHGSIDNLPDDTIVEVNAVVGSYGIQPLHVGPLPEALAARLRLHASVQKLTVEAALTGDRHTALQAFQLDPLISSRVEPQDTARMLDEMLAANARYLPQFA